eukprot:scaffold190311_cov20-Prasinocladus_malaysianus.AAC.1
MAAIGELLWFPLTVLDIHMCAQMGQSNDLMEKVLSVMAKACQSCSWGFNFQYHSTMKSCHCGNMQETLNKRIGTRPRKYLLMVA